MCVRWVGWGWGSLFDIVLISSNGDVCVFDFHRVCQEARGRQDGVSSEFCVQVKKKFEKQKQTQ